MTGTQLLSENSKMVKTTETNEGFAFMDWAILPVITCSRAEECSKWCFGKKGRYVFDNVKRALDYRLKLTFQPFFFNLMDSTIKEKEYKLRGKKKLVIRIHSVGDFGFEGRDRVEYFDTWVKIARANPNVIFYTYTKCVGMVKEYKRKYSIPENLSITYSWGGTQDELIEKDDKQAKVIMKGEKIEEGWVDATDNDMIPIVYTHVALPIH